MGWGSLDYTCLLNEASESFLLGLGGFFWIAMRTIQERSMFEYSSLFFSED